MIHLKQLIESAKKKDEVATMSIINRFSPILLKYQRMMDYDEDFSSDFVLELIRIIENIDFDKFNNDINDGVIINYISTSLYHSYIKLSKDKRNYNIVICDEDLILQVYESSINEYNDNSFDLWDSIKAILTAREYFCIVYIYKFEYTVSEIAEMLKTSRQAVDKIKQRI